MRHDDGGGVHSDPGVGGTTAFFNGGDTVSMTGAGGPGLPAFGAQTIVILWWTGAGAGKVAITYITNTDDGSKTLSCSFDALAGTVPAKALMMLDVGTAPGLTGHEYAAQRGS